MATVRDPLAGPALKLTAGWVLLHAALLAGIAFVLLVYIPRHKTAFDEFALTMSKSTILVLDLSDNLAGAKKLALAIALVILAAEGVGLYPLARRPETVTAAWFIGALVAAALFAGLVCVLVAVFYPTLSLTGGPGR